MDNTSGSLELFNKIFPNSQYREVYPLPPDDVEKEIYQKAKAPMSVNISSYAQIKNTSNRIGWIVSTGYIVIDIDNKEHARIVYEILAAQKISFSCFLTKHGGHFIFKNPKNIKQDTDVETSIGIPVDIRSNEKGYIILPEHDKDRKWAVLVQNMSDVPFFLLPIKKLKTELTTDFSTLEVGSRNGELHKHIMSLKDYAPELTKEEKKSSIEIINKFILKDPLSEEELRNTVLRPEILDQLTDEEVEKKSKLVRLADKIIKEKQIICADKLLYSYNGKYYRYIDDWDLTTTINLEYDQNILRRDRWEVVDFIKLRSGVPREILNTKWHEIVCNNGILNLKTKELYPHTALSINTIAIPQNYNANPTYSLLVDEFFNTVSSKNADKKKLLYEIMGLCLLQKNFFEEFYVIVGDGCTGKSTYLKLIRKLVGDDNISALSLNDLSEKFRVEKLFGKIVNLGDDIDFTRPMKNTEDLKKFVTGELVTVEEKHGKIFTISNFAKLIFTSNGLLKTYDKTNGFYRRLNIIDMNARIPNPDPLFMERFTANDYEYLLFKCVEAISEALKRGKLSTYLGQAKLKDDFKAHQSTVIAFMTDNNYTVADIDKIRTITEIFKEYVQYCKDCHISEGSIQTKSRFEEEIMSLFFMEKKNTTYGVNAQGKPNQQWRFVSKE